MSVVHWKSEKILYYLIVEKYAWQMPRNNKQLQIYSIFKDFVAYFGGERADTFINIREVCSLKFIPQNKKREDSAKTDRFTVRYGWSFGDLLDSSLYFRIYSIIYCSISIHKIEWCNTIRVRHHCSLLSKLNDTMILLLVSMQSAIEICNF